MANNLRVDTIQDVNGKVIYSQTSNSAQIGDSSVSGTSLTLPQRYPTPPTDHSNDPLVPTRVLAHTDGHFYMEGSAVNSAQVGGDVDYFTIKVGSQPITSLYLSYYSSVDPVGFFAIQQGSQWTAGQNPALMLTYGHIGPTTTKPQGSNLISGYTLLANTEYTIWVQQTGSNIMYWAISTNPAYQGRVNSEKYTFQNLTVTNKLTTSRVRVNTRLQLGNNTRAVLDLGSATDGIILPNGTTAQRPSSPQNGMIRWNNTESKLETYYESKWQNVILEYAGIGSSQSNPATSASQILATDPTAPSGLYWLQPPSWSSPAQIYCEMTKHGGGWMYIYQKQCTNDVGLYDSDLTSKSGTQNHATSNFNGCQTAAGTNYTPLDMWDAFVGAGNNARMYAREIQTTGGTYDESQRYVSSTDGPIFSKTTFRRLFAGQFANGQFQSGVTVYFNNGSSVVSGKIGTTWSSPALATINNGNIDQELYFCNGETGGDSNWSFALMKGGTPYPRLADSNNGGNRHNNVTRWAIIAIKA